MKTRWLIFALVLLPTFGLSGGFSVRNPAIRNPIGIGTAPVSSYRNGLVTTPVPIDATSDLSITGNVRGGKHFRGNVPYRSVSDFGLNPGSSSLNSHKGTPSLNSFLRDTAGSEDFGRRSRVGYAAQPYYSPDESVARTVPGRAEVLTPRRMDNGHGTRQNGISTTNRLFTMESMPNQHVTARRETTTDQSGLQRFQTRYGPLNEDLSTSDSAIYRGISSNLENIERLAPGESQTTDIQNDKIAIERLRKQSQRSFMDSRRASRLKDRDVSRQENVYKSEFGKSVPTGLDIKEAEADQFKLSNKTFEPPIHSTAKKDAVQSQTESEREYRKVLGRIKQQLDELSRSVESRLQTSPDENNKIEDFSAFDSTNITKSEISRPEPKSGDLSSIQFADSNYKLKMHEPRLGSQALKTATKINQTDNKRTERPSFGGRLRTAQEIRELPEDIGNLSRIEMSSEANRIMGGHKNHNTFATHKFSQHLQDAEDYLRIGKYYKAADSFTLALVYNPDNPKALAGRSHALFAAGEYISSALFLTRALAIDPEYAKARVDFTALLGGAKRLSGRIADIERWFSRSGSGQLQLLLGYVYYQRGRLSEAKRAIQAAGKKMPQSPAVAAISKAIDYASLRR